MSFPSSLEPWRWAAHSASRQETGRLQLPRRGHNYYWKPWQHGQQSVTASLSQISWHIHFQHFPSLLQEGLASSAVRPSWPPLPTSFDSVHAPELSAALIFCSGIKPRKHIKHILDFSKNVAIFLLSWSGVFVCLISFREKIFFILLWKK